MCLRAEPNTPWPARYITNGYTLNYYLIVLLSGEILFAFGKTLQVVLSLAIYRNGTVINLPVSGDQGTFWLGRPRQTSHHPCPGCNRRFDSDQTYAPGVTCSLLFEHPEEAPTPIVNRAILAASGRVGGSLSSIRDPAKFTCTSSIETNEIHDSSWISGSHSNGEVLQYSKGEIKSRVLS